MSARGHAKSVSGWGQDGVWLQDLVSFTVFAKKCKSNHIVSELLPRLEKEWLTKVGLLDLYITSKHMLHAFARILPARKFQGTQQYTRVDLGNPWQRWGTVLLQAARRICDLVC